jgi:hypothetical protein
MSELKKNGDSSIVSILVGNKNDIVTKYLFYLNILYILSKK